MIRGQSGGVSDVYRAVASVITDAAAATGPSTPELHSRLKGRVHDEVIAALDESDDDIGHDDYEPLLEDPTEVKACVRIQSSFRGFVVRKNLRLEEEARQHEADQLFLSYHPFQKYAEFDIDQSRTRIISVVIKDYQGDRHNGRAHGKGTAQLLGGHKYTGDWENGVMHGSGEYYWADGVSYIGHFLHGSITGTGKYTWPDKTTYIGDVLNGLRHGNGVLQHGKLWARYEGQWSGGVRNGRGVLKYDQKGRVWFDGEWKGGVRTGQGTMQYASGSVYEGEWQGDMRNGQGAMWWLNGDAYVGQWENGMPHGHGELTHGSNSGRQSPPAQRPGSARSLGSVSMASMGHLPSVSPPVYGDMKKRTEDPFDVRDNVNRYSVVNKYAGDWVKGKRHGHGTYLYANGCKYVGEWECDLKDGAGVFYSEDGKVVQVTFEKDILVSRSGKKISDTEVGLSAVFGREDDTISITGLLGGLMAGLDKTTATSESDAVQRVVSRYVSDIRRIYQRYASITVDADVDVLDIKIIDPNACGGSGGGVLRRQQLWHMMQVTGVVEHTGPHPISLAQIDRAITFDAGVGLLDDDMDDVTIKDIHHPAKIFLPREFAAALVRIAYVKYGAMRVAEAKRSDSPRRRLPGGGILSDCLIRLITECLLPNSAGVDAAEANAKYLGITVTLMPYIEDLWTVYYHYCSVVGVLDDDDTRDRTMSIRHFLTLLSDYGLYDDNRLTVTRLLGAFGIVESEDEPKRLDIIAQLQARADADYAASVAAAQQIDHGHEKEGEMTSGVSGVEEDREKRRRERKGERRRAREARGMKRRESEDDSNVTSVRDHDGGEGEAKRRSRTHLPAKKSVAWFSERESSGLNKQVDLEMVFSEFVDGIVACAGTVYSILSHTYSACIFVPPPPPITQTPQHVIAPSPSLPHSEGSECDEDTLRPISAPNQRTTPPHASVVPLRDISIVELSRSLRDFVEGSLLPIADEMMNIE